MSQPTFAMASGSGVPNRSVIRSNWWTTFFPGNKGFPVSISANMHPILHISIAGVYWENKVKSVGQNLIYHVTIILIYPRKICPSSLQIYTLQYDF